MTKKIVVSVSNDLITDQRVERVCKTLLDLEYEGLQFDMLLVGRLLDNKQELIRPYETKRFKLLFNKGPLFYLALNYKLFFLLRKERPDVLLVNDLDTLLGNFLFQKIAKNKPVLVYDSHEYFTEVPELQGRLSRNIWLRLEKWIFPKLEHVYTVSKSIAMAYNKQYDVDVSVIRNLPILEANKVGTELLKGDKKLIYQGAVNVNRGLELMVAAMPHLPDYHLYIYGTGDVFHEVESLIASLDIGHQVSLMGRVEPDALRSLTSQADLGLSFEEDIGLSYRYALPNKLFDYIHAEIPVLVSSLPEMKSIVEEYAVGEILRSRNAENVADQIKGICENSQKKNQYIDKAKKAKQILNWENEEKMVEEIFKRILIDS